MDKHTTLQTSQMDGQTELEAETDLTDKMNENDHLTSKETRQIVTPYAFFVADELLGTPLAGPFRRGFGMLIDLFLVSLLTQVSSLVLAAIAAWTFFRAGNRLKTKKRFNVVRIILRLLVALLLFVVAMGIVEMVNDNNSPDNYAADTSDNNDNAVGGMELVALTAKYLIDTKTMKQQVVQGGCEPAFDCIKTLGEELVGDLVNTGLDKDSIDSALEGYLGAVAENISEDQHVELTNHLQQMVENKHIFKDKLVSVPSDPELPVTIKEGPESKGFLNWLENLAEDLGLGLGWAAFYFSIFTAWWKGQTPGKKLLGMKVIKLDNQPLNLWESFGRYGGYAAGLATGLTGFLQVFWDPNRQAIQDKISETLVINLRKPKVAFIKDNG